MDTPTTSVSGGLHVRSAAMSLSPTAAAGRLDLPGLFGESAAVLRCCRLPVLALGAVSAVASGGTALGLFWLYATPVLTALVSSNPAGLASGALLAAAAGWLGSMLVTVQCGALVAQVASQVVDGQAPDLRAAWRRTTTVVARLLLPCLSLSAATLLSGAVAITVVLNALRTVAMTARDDRTGAVTVILALMAGVALAIVAAVAVTWWLRVKLFLLLPAASLEGLAGFAPVRRSWQLTRGFGGHVFGALAIVGLTEGAVLGLGGQLTGLLATPSFDTGIGGLVTLVSQLMPAIAVATALSTAVTTVTWPFLTVMSTLVYRRLAGYRLTPLMSA